MEIVGQMPGRKFSVVTCLNFDLGSFFLLLNLILLFKAVQFEVSH